jgi:hypothetical protein
VAEDAECKPSGPSTYLDEENAQRALEPGEPICALTDV